jgi:hypothetical protein
VALVAGCRGPAKAGEVVTKTVTRKVALKVAGARSVTYNGRAEITAITRNGKREQVADNASAIQTEGPITIGSGQVGVEVGVVGLYTGDGTYIVPRGLGLVTPVGVTTVPADAFVGTLGVSQISVLFYDKDAAGNVGELRFGYMDEPCTLKVRVDATRGSVKCPALLSAAGEKVRLDFRWG